MIFLPPLDRSNKRDVAGFFFLSSAAHRRRVHSVGFRGEKRFVQHDRGEAGNVVLTVAKRDNQNGNVASSDGNAKGQLGGICPLILTIVE